MPQQSIWSLCLNLFYTLNMPAGQFLNRHSLFVWPNILYAEYRSFITKVFYESMIRDNLATGMMNTEQGSPGSPRLYLNH